MAEEQGKTKRFPDPHEYTKKEIPSELEGWEEMYPEHFLFGKEREDWEKKQFWYLDKIHAPEPMPPLDQIFQQAWQISLAQHTTRVFCIPPAQGIAHRIVGCYQYICAIEPPSAEVIKEKAERFGVRAHYPVEHYDELWNEWLDRMQTLGHELKNIEVPQELPKYTPAEDIFPNSYKGYTEAYQLIEAFHKAVDCVYKGWQYHFNYLNLTYLYYLMFADTARRVFPGISESAIGKMVAGAEVSMFRPEEELCRLARQAHAHPDVADILRKEGSAERKMEQLKKFEAGQVWLDEIEKIKDPWLYISCASGWYYYEGSWLNRLDVPFDYLKGYIQRLDRGEKIERALTILASARESLIGEYSKLIKSADDRQSFENAYKDCRTIYKYAEDHLFWVEHWFHTIWYAKVREIARVLVKYGALEKENDIFMFNRLEVPTLIEEAVTCWALGEGVPMLNWKAKAQKRREILKAAAKWSPSPALGVPPKEVAEPLTIMLWGVTTDKVEEWLKGSTVAPENVTEIKGFASSAGVAEGRARVVKSVEEISKLQDGEILVCPVTNPAWAPIFTKIKAAVTDIGGLTCHAAIVCREYGLPSVTGTGVATLTIKTGDLIKVSGDDGTVSIVKRAGQ
jgi:pyruvate,water dikinase